MATNTELVQQLYVAYFNRPGDAAGVEFYVGVLDAGASLEAVRADFVKAKEYTDTYAGKSTEAIVDQIYVNIFGHHADVPGLKYYAGLLTSGAITIDKLPTIIANGAQTTDITAFESKVTAAAAFTDAIAGNAELRIAYANGGATAANIAKGFLASVTDEASLATALASVNTTVQGVIPTTTSNLAQGLDTFLGASGNDVINASASNPTTGADATTLNSADVIDGGAGTDTLNIEVRTAGGTTYNNGIVGTIKNIEIVNVNQVGNTGAAVAVDASLLGSTLTQVWQIGKAGNVTNLSGTATAGFRNVDANVSVATASDVTSAKIALENLGEGRTVTTTGASTVELTGSVKDTNGNGSVAATTLAVTAGKDAQTITVNSAVDVTLTAANAGGSTKAVTTVDASGSAGAITFDASTNTALTTIKGGSGDDTLTITTATVVASTGVDAVGASIVAGAGDDTIVVKTTGTGATTVDAGEGKDDVTITTRGSGVLTVNLGAGDDNFTSSVAIGAKDVIDAGAGIDKLLLSLVGSANIGAFSNFDAFDAVGLTNSLDVDILAVKNTVSEFVLSGAVGTGGATLLNVGANVGVRVTADAGTTDALTITQKAPGALTVTVDADEKSAADTAIDTASAKVVASNATSLNAVFDTSYKASIAGETTSGDNVTTLNLSGAAATAVTVTSGGDLSNNVLAYADTSTGSTGKLATITVTGAQALSLSTTFAATANGLTTVDASAHTGGLTFSLANLADKGTVKLGSGADIITATSASTVGGVESIQGFEKAAAAAAGTDATAAAAAIKDADHLVLASAQVANASSVTGGAVTDKGILTFTGAGPATIADAATIANAAAETAGEALVFEYLGDSYVFVQGVADTLVKITGVTGVTNLVEGTGGSLDHFVLV